MIKEWTARNGLNIERFSSTNVEYAFIGTNHIYIRKDDIKIEIGMLWVVKKLEIFTSTKNIQKFVKSYKGRNCSSPM